MAPSKAGNCCLALVWVLCGLVTVLFPLVYRTMKMNNYDKMFMMYNWEEAQQEYQQAQDEYMNNMEQYYMAQYYNNGAYQVQWEQMRGNYDINQCKWWQVNCIPYYINENGEPIPQAGWYPQWFSGWTETEEQKQMRYENGETSGPMIFVYIWQILMFVIIMVYGWHVIRQNRVVTGLIIALLVFANMAFLSMWMLADNSIITDGQMVQRTGFYGQFPVLMFITNFWYFMFGLVFTIVFVLRGRKMHRDQETYNKNQQLAGASDNYKALPDDSPKANRQPVQPVWTSPSQNTLAHNGETYTPKV